MSKKYRIAIVGATGVVGQTLLSILAERQFPVGELFLMASARSAGKRLRFNGNEYSVSDVANFEFEKADIAFFAAGSDVAAHYAPIAAQAGCWAIDKSSYFRLNPEVPLLVPEVNPQALQHTSSRIIATPNCSTTQMVVALKPIMDAVGIERINVCTYQAVSGTGSAAVSELHTQVRQWAADETLTCQVYPKTIAFNVLPHCDTFQDNGYTKEEMKLVLETQKIFNDATIRINPTAVRVPVAYGHSESVHIETRKKISAAEVCELLRTAPGVKLVDKDYPTPLTHAEGNDEVYVGRVREDISHPHGINLWIVADNLRKGAALNAVQIAELLIA